MVAALTSNGFKPTREGSIVRVTVGEYYTPVAYVTTVVAKWRFSENDRLEEIEVAKLVDAP